MAKTVVHRFEKQCMLTTWVAIGFLFFTTMCAIAAPVNLTSAELSNLTSIKAQAERNYMDWQQANDSLKSKRDELEVLNKEVDSLSKQITSIQTELKKLNDLDVASPEAVNPTKLAQVRRDNESLFNEKGQKSTQVKKLTDEIEGLVVAIKSKSGLDQQLSDKYKIAINAVVDRVVNERKNNYLKTQNVEASGTVSCGAMSVLDCKEKSLKEAERLAIERGSVIYVDSITEIDNSKLTKDQIRSATKGQISNQQILEAKFVSDDTAYKTTIRADVTPVLGSELSAALKLESQTDIEAMIGGGLPKSGFAAETASGVKISVTSITQTEQACDGGDLTSCRDLGNAYAFGDRVKQDYIKAAELYRKVCDESIAALGCNNLGNLYRNGQGVIKDYSKAAGLYKKSCDHGIDVGCKNLEQMYSSKLIATEDANSTPLASQAIAIGVPSVIPPLIGNQAEQQSDCVDAAECIRLGVSYENGNSVKRDYSKAAELYQKACDIGTVIGCAYLGNLYRKGSGVKLDYSKAFELFKKACDGGNLLGCHDLANAYSAGIATNQDYLIAADLYNSACERGYAPSCASLAYSYSTGNGVKQDYSKAVELSKKSCDSGFAGGCNTLGIAFEYGNGVKQDYIKAAELYKQGCDANGSAACSNLGNFYHNGRGVSKDYSKAVDLFQKACSGGDARGCNNLGWAYKNGDGVKQDYFKANELYVKACDGGYAMGCNGLGYDYQFGIGVVKNKEKALAFYQRSCELKYQTACDNYAKLK